jgi:hypothetical protein
MNLKSLVFYMLGALSLVACGEDDPVVTANNANNTTNNATNGTNNASNNETNNSTNGTNNASNNASNNSTNNTTNTCVRLATDYTPGADDSWAACISDDNIYHAFEPSISSAARVAAFETIADLLWRNGVPSSADFTNAYDAFAPGEGLLSRVSRREDEHFAPVTDGAGLTLSCRDEGVPAMDIDRCVGPAQMVPLLTTAFEQGILGNEPEVNAATIEATLLWFFHISVFKEATTCAIAKKDCDSAYAYYTGDLPRDLGIGLAGYLQDSAPIAHDYVWDGILGIRCWRDLDGADVATDLGMRDQALAQVDRGMLYGVSKLVLARLAAMEGHTGTAKEADLAFIKILGGSLVRETEARAPGAGIELQGELRNDSANFSATAVSDYLTAGFPCP